MKDLNTLSLSIIFVKLSIRKGLSFGLTSAIITTLGILVGLEAGTGNKGVVLGGIITVAIADALSDSLGMHISEESAAQGRRSVWEATFATLLSKFIFALTFILPVAFLELGLAVIISVVWGLCLLSFLSYKIAQFENENPFHVIGEHLGIMVLVIVLTHFVGRWASMIF